ncbi:16973_t:CDS:1, partial [Cetraspora pellucida]
NAYTTINVSSDAFWPEHNCNQISSQLDLVIIVIKKLGFPQQRAKARAFATQVEYYFLDPKNEAG